MPDLSEAPLIARFRARGVPLAEIGNEGPQVPLSFGDGPAEQRSTRSAAGLFDFSFMACLEVRGPQAAVFLDRLQTRDLARLPPGRLAYTLLLRDVGTVLVDATVWCLEANRYWLVSGRRSDVDHVRAMAAEYDVEIDDRSARTGVISVQGPRSAALLLRCGATSLPRFFQFSDAILLGHHCLAARLGYTGEAGYELFVDATDAPELWEGLAATGGALEIRECGFEAADALRIEAGFILFTRELAEPVTPYELGLGRLVDFRNRPFAGSDILAARRWREPTKAFVGLVLDGPGAPDIARRERELAGPSSRSATVTSVAYSALFRRWLGLGFVRPENRYPGSVVSLPPRAPARVARLPFYDPVRRLPRLAE